MKTIQLKGILCILGLLLSVSDLAGQKVITDHPSANGYPVIDLRELSPLGCLLTAKEATDRRTQINGLIPSNIKFLEVGSGVSGVNGIWNARMSSQYQVMRADQPIVTTDWANAYELCKQYNGERGASGQWRLPTNRELIIIWGLHPQLLKKGEFKSFNGTRYWSCTEDTANNAWFGGFASGDMNNVPKTEAYQVRCVRDLE